MIIRVNENNYLKDAFETWLCILNRLIILQKIIEWGHSSLTAIS